MTTETILDVTSEEKKTSVKTEVKNITEVENAPKSDSQNDVKQLTQPKSDVKSAEKNLDKVTTKEGLPTSTKQKKEETKKIVKAEKEMSVHVYDTIVVGAGISGLAAAYQMNQAGYDDYIVLEKASRVAGTWRDNNYTGRGCDVPSAVYSFSFSPSHEWSHLFAKQPEIFNYL